MLYTFHVQFRHTLNYSLGPKEKKSKGVKSGDLACQGTGPPQPPNTVCPSGTRAHAVRDEPVLYRARSAAVFKFVMEHLPAFCHGFAAGQDACPYLADLKTLIQHQVFRPTRSN